MADDTVIKVGTDVDVSSLQSGMSNAASIVRQNLEIVKEQYKVASTEVRQSVQRIVDAEKQHAEATVAGYSAIAAVLETAAAEERTALDGLIDEQQRAAASMAQLRAEVAALGGAMGHTVSEVSAASATIRVFEGNMPIRAVERFAVSTLGLGPILQAAFPIVGMIAAGEMLVHVGEKVWALIDDFIHLKEAQEQVHESALRMGSALVASYEHQQQVIVETLRMQGKVVEAAQKETNDLASKPIDLSKFLKTDEIEKKFKQLPETMRKQLADTFTQVIPAELDSKIAQVQSQLSGIAAETAKLKAQDTSPTQQALMSGPVTHPGDDLRVMQARALEQQKVMQDVYSGLLDTLKQYQSAYVSEVQQGGQKITNAHAEVEKKAEQEAKQASSAAMAAARERTQLLRQADQDELADQRAAHEMSIDDTIAYWQKKLAAEQGNAQRLREIKRELGTLYQQKDKQDDHEAVESIRELVATAKDSGGAAGALSQLNNAMASGSLSAKQYAEATKELPRIQSEADKQFAQQQKTFVDESVTQWETMGRRSAQSVIDMWTKIETEYAGNAAIVKEAISKVEEAEVKLREEREKQIDTQNKEAISTLEYTHALEQQLITENQKQGLPVGTQAQVPAPDIKSVIATLGAVLDEDVQTNQAMLASDQAYWQQRVNLAVQNEQRIAQTFGQESEQYKQAQAQVQTVQQQMNEKMLADQIKLVNSMKQEWNSFFQTFNQGFTQAINGAITGQKSFGASMEQLYRQLTLQLIDYVALWMLKQVEMWLMSKLFATNDNNIQAQGNAQAIAQNSAKNVAMAESDAGLAAAGTFAYYSAIDPPAAPEMAAAAYAEGQAYVGMAAYETGGYVPRTGIAMLHKNETVINSPVTNMLAKMAANGGGTGHSIGSFHYHAATGASTNAEMEGQRIYSAVSKEMRKRNRSAR